MDHQTWNLGGEFEQTNLQKFKCSELPGEGEGEGGDYGSLKLIDASCSFCPLTVLVKLRVELFSLNSDTLTRFFFLFLCLKMSFSMAGYFLLTGSC